MADVTEVVIDRKVLSAFKRRALKAYPREILEQVVGTVVGTQARIFAFRDLEHQGSTNAVIMDEDVNPMTEGETETPYSILGTIHTHPQDTVDPSELDWDSMRQDGEFVMGVCAVRKTAKRRFVSFAFFNRARTHVQLTIAEPESSAMGATA
ncbi:MAG: Mov34/MPN/PAD-1 family protein [Terriglobales bacterium]